MSYEGPTWDELKKKYRKLFKCSDAEANAQMLQWCADFLAAIKKTQQPDPIPGLGQSGPE